MADGQQQPMSEVSGMPQGANPVDQFRAWSQAQTQIGPSMSHTQAQPGQPQPQQRTDHAAQSGGKKASLKDLANSIQNVVGQVSQKIQQRKSTEQQHLFDRFTQSTQGIQQAQAQLQEAQEAIKKNPQDQEAVGKLKQAQDAINQNKTILDAMFNGPHGEKNAKLLSKGFGIDDKNADTPERQNAIKAMQKAMGGISEKPAAMLSQLPQTMQPSPQAQAQQMSGVRPPTGGQQLNAMVQTRGQDMKAKQEQAKLLQKNGISDAYIQLRASKQGEVAEPPKGTDGEWTFRPMTEGEKAVYGAAQQGKIAWTMKDGKPVSVLRNPQTNQIIPNTENPALLPPAYLTEHIHEGNYFWTDNDGNLHEMPVTTSTRAALPGGSTKHTVTPMNPKAQPGGKIIGKARPNYADVQQRNQLRMNFEKSYEKPAEDVEKSFRMADSAFQEYSSLQKEGKDFPSGAQSMLMLSQHLSTTFGNVKGSRVTKDMIHEHLGARSISDAAHVAVQKLVDGDVLSPAQWDAFHDLVSQSRKESWTIAAKEAKRAKVPMDFVPPDLLKKGVGAPEGFQPGRDGAYVGSDGRTVVGWQIDGKYVSE